jgi:hypothetical protein
MPLELALRPRIRLRDDFTAPPRRSRLRLPRFVLPALGYWLAAGGVTYALTHWHDSAEPASAAEELNLNEPLATSQPAPDLPFRSPPVELERQAEQRQPELNAEPEPEPEAARARARREPHEERAVQALAAPAPGNQPTDDLSLALALPDAQQAELPSAPKPSSPERSRGAGSLPSCEAAAASATQDLDFTSSDRTADLPSSAIAGVLENGAWLSSCGVPTSTSLEVCVAIKGGRVTAATVVSRPADASLSACVKQRAAALQFPYSARLDIARTRF